MTRSSTADAGAAATPAASPPYGRHDPAFRRITIAMVLAGWATFALLYGVQPLMPALALEFGVSATASSLVVSLTTGTMAFMMVVMGSLSDRLGRKAIMIASIFLSGTLTCLAAASQAYWQLLALRAGLGITFAGLPAVAMAYLGEEVDRKALSYAMGLYVAGAGFGGMSGRVLSAWATELFSWRVAMLVLGAGAFACGAAFIHLLPASRHFVARGARFTDQLRDLKHHLGDPVLRLLFLLGLLIMGGFTTLYNYAGFRLSAAPFNLGQGAIGLLFSVYLVGVLASAVSGTLGARLGRGRLLPFCAVLMVLGTELSRPDSIILLVAGLAFVTFGFFAGHSAASAAVTRLAPFAKAQAAALYLFSYYMGSSVLGTLGGMAWEYGAWPGIAWFVTVSSLGALAASLLVRRRLLAQT